MRTVLRRFFVLFLVGLTAVVLGGCYIDASGSPRDTRIEFEETRNLGYSCGGPLTSWTVYNRQTGEEGTAGCEQPVLFVGLAPDTSYTFDISGYYGDQLCWEGTCSVYASYGSTSYADCSRQIVSLCGF